MEELLRLRRDTLGAAETGSMDTATNAVRDLEAMEMRQAAVCGATSKGSVGRSGCTNGRKFPRPMAYRKQPRHEVRVSQCLLRSAWTASVVHRCLAQSNRTAGCGPARPVVWQGRRGDSPPYADSARSVHLPAPRLAGRVTQRPASEAARKKRDPAQELRGVKSTKSLQSGTYFGSGGYGL
jgi:hypothetical protein